MSVDYKTDVILLTCASGKQCSHLLPLIAGKWKCLRLVVNSVSSEERLKKAYPNAEVTRADLAEPQECKRVLKGVTTVYQVIPGFHPHETEIGYNMIDAAITYAKEGSFKHYIFSSVLNTQLRKLMNHDCKRYVEEYLMESGLNYTILQPSHFMDMFPIKQLTSEKSPVYQARWDPSIPFSYTALHDLGEATAKIMDEREKHYMAQYPLVSTSPPMGYGEVCKIASKRLGKDIKVEHKSMFEAAEGLMKAIGGPDPPPYTRDGVQRMLLWYNYHGLMGNPNVLEWILGRKPMSWEAWIEDKMQQE